jgi:myb proto-oncogene protein
MRKREWRANGDNTLKDAVQMHGGKNWAAIAVLVPGRLEKRFYKRWHDVLDPSIDRASGRMGSWRADEDDKLRDAVQTHGGKNWATIAALVPGRSQNQCYNRWYNALNRSIDLTGGRAGIWTLDDEEGKLKDAVKSTR